MKWLLATLILLAPLGAFAQLTQVTAQIKDSNNSLYVNCQWSVVFVHQNTTPGVGPDAPAALLNGQQGHCDSSGNLFVGLADNINTITPTPSQWSFSICSAPGYVPGGTFCKTNILVTITGASMNLTSFFQPLMPLLPTNSGGGVGANPGGIASNLQFNNSGIAFGGLANVAAGSALVSQGTNATPSFQVKPIYDARDFGAQQNGSSDDTPAIDLFLTTVGSNQSTLQFSGVSKLESVTFPPNITVQMNNGGGLSPISSTTPIGGATFVQGSGTTNSAIATTSCTVTLSGVTAGNALVFMENHISVGAVILAGSVTDNHSDAFINLTQQGFNFTSVNTGWVASNVAGGNTTITVAYPTINGAVQNSCIAWEIGGMGPVVGLNAGIADIESATWTNAFMQSPGVQVPGPLTVTAGALVIGFGGQSWQGVTCSAGSGYTQPAGTAGQIQGGSQPVTGFQTSFCAEYQLSATGGSTTVQQNISMAIDSPCPCPPGLNRYWAYTAMALVPASSIINIQGPITAGAGQIFFNSLPGQGLIDLTGNNSVDKVFPEWWGAKSGSGGNATTNLNAIQASINAAYGTNRFNGSQLNVYNRELHFGGVYNVNGTLTGNHMNGFNWTCSQRFSCGLVETATNTTLFQVVTGGAYGIFDGIGFSTNVAQNLASPLVSLDFTGVASDFATQFVTFRNNFITGAGLAKIGVEIAKSGGGAQGSNIIFESTEISSFTEACAMMGAGSGGTSTAIATNAIAIKFDTMDMQGCSAYGIEDFGASFMVLESTFENGFGTPGTTANSGYDVWVSNLPAGQNVYLAHNRSESLYSLGGGQFVVDQWQNLNDAYQMGVGNSITLGTTIQGCTYGGHGVYYTVTTAGTYQGLGNCTNNASWLSASSGTSTTIVDSVGGFTVNAWVGYQVTINAGTNQKTYCVITSNSATTFTCSGGWQTYVLGVTPGSPDNTSKYIVEPNWGTQTSEGGGLAWTAITKTISLVNSIVHGMSIPGLQVQVGGGRSFYDGLQVNRSDWVVGGTLPLDDINVPSIYHGVQVGLISTGSGYIDLQAYMIGNTWNRNGGTSIPQVFENVLGTTELHWASGKAAGGPTTGDVYMGLDQNLPNSGQADLHIINNSSGTAEKWTFLYNGGQTTPGNCSGVGTAANPSVVSCSAATAGSFSCATNASTGTCQVNTSTVTANSQILVVQDSSLGTKLSVTCNTNNVLSTTAPLIASRSAGTSFTINLGTVATNPGCFSYWIIN